MRRIPAAVLLAFAAATLAAASASGAPARETCTVATGVLPAWARAGFSDPAPRLPHVLGHSGRIVAIVFGYPLSAPPAPDHDNKILWVSRTPIEGVSTLTIRARRIVAGHAAGPPVVRRLDGGPGPSIVDLPGPGCWRLTLSWQGRSDSLALRYRPG